MTPFDPLPSYRFLVTLDPADAYLPPAQAALVTLVSLGAFQEVKGLGADLEVMQYPEGGQNGLVHQLPVRHSWNRISLRRGLLSQAPQWPRPVMGSWDPMKFLTLGSKVSMSS